MVGYKKDKVLFLTQGRRYSVKGLIVNLLYVVGYKKDKVLLLI
jgi:hypothetical protein